MNRPPRILCNTSVLSRNLSSRVRKKNHYDSLGVEPQATQGEIKSAYFKKTMQYHPDRNTSEEAKIKFQDISEAYEVLGNYENRRLYDRGMQIRREEIKKPAPKPVDLRKEAERVNAVYRRTSSTSAGRMYDFETWTKEHYQRNFRSSWFTQQRVQEWHRERERMLENRVDPRTQKLAMTLLMTLLACLAGVVTTASSADLPKITHESSGKGASDGDT